jgi:cell division transport system ATP-binding protein
MGRLMAPAPTHAKIGRGRPRAAGASTPVVELRDVTKVYDGGSVGLERASIKIGRGEFVFLVGPTGCGKSTCLRLLMKELEPTQGELSIAGRTLGEIPRSRVPYLRRNIGAIFQDYKLLPARTVYDNVAYSLQVIGESRQEIRRKVPDILRMVGLSTKLHNFPDELSGGEQQRVSIARAFVNHPPLLLADEPTGNLDPETSVGIMQLLYRINRTGTTVVVATHDHAMVDRMRRRVIELSRGKIVRDELGGQYAPRDMTTAEFGALLREPAPEPHRFIPAPAPAEAQAQAPASAPARRWPERAKESEPEDLFDDAFTDDVFSD